MVVRGARVRVVELVVALLAEMLEQRLGLHLLLPHLVVAHDVGVVELGQARRLAHGALLGRARLRLRVGGRVRVRVRARVRVGVGVSTARSCARSEPVSRTWCMGRGVGVSMRVSVRARVPT